MGNDKYKIGELVELAGVTKRTVHYYLSRGLLPPSEGMGISTTYSDEHLYRILLIKKYQGNYLPLDEIKKIINSLSLDEVKEKLEENFEDYNYSIQDAKSNYIQDDVYKKVKLDYDIEIYYPQYNTKARELVEIFKNISENSIKGD